jgi:Cu(I)/Ag(I) efflux system membrane fusion protein
MLKKYLDKLKPYLEKLQPLAQTVREKAVHFYRHTALVFKKYWARPGIRLASYIIVALILGVNIGKMIAPTPMDSSASRKLLDVEKNGIINIDLPGVTLSPDNFEFIQVKFGVVPTYLQVPGRLAFNGERLKVISARAPGRIERIYAFDGAIVKTGQALADYFSPDYVSAQTEFILSSKMVAALQKNQVSGLYQDAQSTAEAAANHLRVLGASNEDINRLRTTGQATPTFPIRAPIDGVVIKRAVDPGAYLNTGDILATIADPKNLWFLGNVYEQDVGKIKVGDTFRLKVESYPDREFIAKANYVGAAIDPITHALVVRCEIDNSDGLLKPEMFVSGTLEVGQTEAIVVPMSAVIQARNVRYAIIKTGDTTYSRRPIYGFAVNSKEFAVTQGLETGQLVVYKGATLLNQRFLREED